MIRYLAVGLLISPFLLGGMGCSKHEDVWAGSQGKKKILTSFPPIYCFVKNVVGDEAAVQCLLTNIGPHGYDQVTTADKIKARKADVFFANGLQLDDFATRLVVESGNKSLILVKVADLLPGDLKLEIDEKAHAAMPDHPPHGKFDPHIWLSPNRAIEMVKVIAKKMGEIDPSRQAVYDKNATAYIEELKRLQQEGKEAFANKKNLNIVTAHDSLQYFEKDFGLNIVEYIRARPEEEPVAKRLAKIVQDCRDLKVSAICFEPQYDKKDADNIAAELAAKNIKVAVVKFDTMETAPGFPNPDPDFYVNTLRTNILTLAKVLP